MSTMLECGHAAQGTHVQDHNGLGENHPSCAICSPSDEACQPDTQVALRGRQAYCAYYKHQTGVHSTKRGGKAQEQPQPSSSNLPFFEFTGHLSNRALSFCKNCGMHANPHMTADPAARLQLTKRGMCQDFTPHGAYEFDSYYCGCWGWD